ncbi:PRC-barrel domain-containing protein [Falsirhodobacter halotolerans]|uniref:PRC-barrel domain-containing protein n=1 Tax=Falsirhodobacter halotolerans TaxID=1146892 RepID=UPI001FD4BE87|nr:PRC-barrel domain-containing protein [Falsirhodobacter halotolerans]MCJ8140020.1 PRC-barrel domain-containing protein [Falsirhodobacter halotolerans]
MIKLLSSTAVVAMLAAPVVAQTATTTAPEATTTAPAAATTGTSDMGFNYTVEAGDKSAETFIGKRLYVSEVEVDMNADMTEVDQDWDDVGEISDLVIGEDGMVKAVLTDFGGFLGMGEKTVAVSMDDLAVIRDGDSQNDYFIVLQSDRASLENAPEFKWPEM